MRVSKPAPAPVDSPLGPTDHDLFLQAMRFVQPLPERGARARVATPRAPDAQLRARRLHAEGSGQAAGLTHALPPPGQRAAALQDWSRLAAHLDPDAHEFLQAGCGPDLLRGLRRGKWIPQASLDLHGSTLDQARERLDRFLATCLDHDIRCVRVIHGKGFGSRQGESVLKAATRLHLSRLQAVQAWVQCGHREGGAGAVNALLRAPSGAKG